jgi:hypothetical protein
MHVSVGPHPPHTAPTPLAVRKPWPATGDTRTLRLALHRAPFSRRYVDDMTDDEIDAAFARLTRFMEAHPETMWDPSKSFASAESA